MADISEAMVEAAFAAYADGRYSTHEGKMWAALVAALSASPASAQMDELSRLRGALEWIDRQGQAAIRQQARPGGEEAPHPFQILRPI